MGISGSNPLEYYYTYAFDAGGRIIRDKLWWYAAVSKQAQKVGAIGFVMGPNADGCYTCLDTPLAYSTHVLPQWSGKFNFQPTDNLRMNFVWSAQRKNVDYIKISELPKETVAELPQMALVASFMKLTA